MRIEFITWFFSIATLTIFFSITIPVHSQCLEDQKSLLLQLKSSLEFDPDSSVKLVNWTGTDDCCQWNGVTCNRFGRVIGLDLNTDSISGGLNDSSSLFGLKFLEKLDLANNSFNFAEIPSNKGTATLGVLNLRNNSLTGNIMGAFPEGCTLRTLELNGNKLEGEIPNSLANCANAEVLNFGANNINGNFPCFLVNLSELCILVLRSNKFHGNIGCPGIHNYLWPKLQIIDLALNNFNGILPPNFFLQRKAMMDGGNRQPNANHLRFDFSQNIYYQDSVTVVNKGNNGLYGAPLTPCCKEVEVTPPTMDGRQSYTNEDEINWIYITATLGYTVGFGVIVGPLLYSKRWRQCYYKPVDRVIVRILHHREQRSRNQRRRNNINQLRKCQHQ
ncbi:hypothetical protein RHSIM_Rhsim05G0220900 [Rhododendron simsii]|uniref:Leucine-rich repeat-containing N-terminal plant-type domain-containing protein n=1 Tax=Rhododendron simsii TaxID=118357 RepID=A0A834GYE4_RHOSS|nr:hypothetical protein RHSIM_Rhsim05G0220900 [Rhododendron simsii]